ncbi:MAG: AAA family ATPase [Lachnospiraceae bacterium]|nr:AAA family ATPase [Lachnospiraceae bacterium]
MYFKRKAYEKLLQWKKEDSGKVLELSGARQVGKTYLLKKFAEENFDHVVYINMAELSGEEFLQCMDKIRQWEPGTPRIEKPVHQILKLFDDTFQDTKDTIIIIDEIQESSRVYNLIRTFAREFNCYVAVTGSYLGRLLDKDFFLPAGDLETMTLETLSFEEFTDIFGKSNLYRTIDLYGSSDKEEYDQLRALYDIYQRIGGYPSVVSMYLEHNDFQKCEAEIKRLIEVFTNESKRYFDDVLDTNLFAKLFSGVAITLIREKQGVRDLTEEVSRIVYQQESGRITKRMINHALGWLQASHIISYAGKSVDCDYLDVKENARFYFLDMGMAHYFLTRTGAEGGTVKGIIAENFVYRVLLEHIEKDIAGRTPWFAIYQKTKGELDFFVRSLLDYKNYGIEVKSEAGSGKTARELLKDGKLDYLYFMKGDTQGGIAEEGTVITIPLYLAGRVRFDLSVQMENAKIYFP